MTYLVEFDKASGSGLYTYGRAGEDLGNRKIVYINTDGVWMLANAQDAATMPVIGITMGAISSGRRGEILISGYIGLSSWSWTPSASLYASATNAGELTSTAPPNPIYFVQEVGQAVFETQIFFNPRQVAGETGATYTNTVSIAADELGKPAANNPNVIDQDNLTLYSFTVNTDFMTYKLPVPSDYGSGGLKFNVVWTNDGNVNDLNKNVRAQFDYQVSSTGDVVSGSHANSPKNVNDSYTSAAGWIECYSDFVTIADGDFETDDCIYVKVSFVTAPDTVLTCEPHLIGVCLQYTAYINTH